MPLPDRCGLERRTRQGLCALPGATGAVAEGFGSSFARDARTGGRDAHPTRNLPGGRIPDSLAAVVRKAMAFERDQRYPHVADLQRDVTAYQTGFATSAENAGVVKQFALLVKRHKGIFTIEGCGRLDLAALRTRNLRELYASKATLDHPEVLAELNELEVITLPKNLTDPGFLRKLPHLRKIDNLLTGAPAEKLKDAADFWKEYDAPQAGSLRHPGEPPAPLPPSSAGKKWGSRALAEERGDCPALSFHGRAGMAARFMRLTPKGAFFAKI